MKTKPDVARNHRARREANAAFLAECKRFGISPTAPAAPITVLHAQIAELRRLRLLRQPVRA